MTAKDTLHNLTSRMSEQQAERVLRRMAAEAENLKLDARTVAKLADACARLKGT